MRNLLSIIFLLPFFYTEAFPLHSDSVKVFKMDNEYFLGVYGVVLPSGPCTIVDSAKIISPDSIFVSLCFLYGNSQSSGCKASDTIYLGHLNEGNYSIKVCLSSSDTFINSCSYPFRTDTINFFLLATAVNETSDDNFSFFYNAQSMHITGNFSAGLGKVAASIISTDGRIITAPVQLSAMGIDIDLGFLPAGLYFLQLQDDRQRVVKKFVKY